MTEVKSFRRVAGCILANVTVALPALPVNTEPGDLSTKALAKKHWNTRKELRREIWREDARVCQVQRILFVLQHPVALTLTAITLTLIAITLTLIAPAHGFAPYELDEELPTGPDKRLYLPY